jgi:ubiquinone/menaquinone biosynthesis C-methylase UbiE
VAHHGHHHDFKGIERWITVLDSPEREKKQLPNEVIAKLGIQRNDVVADIGAGTGYFAIRIAEMYPQVRVIAADVEHEMVDYLQSQSKARELLNLEPVLIDSSKPQLPVKANLALFVDTLHHIDDRITYLKSLKESLAADSRIAVIDYKKEAVEGPPEAFRISIQELVDELKAIGYALESDLRFLSNQYFLIFRQV